MYHAHKQGAVCVFRTQAVWKQACLWSMALGPRSPSESVIDLPRGTIGGPLLRRETTARRKVTVCAQERSLQYGTETPQGVGG